MKTALPEQRQNFAIMNEDNMLLGQAEDKIEQCYNRGYLTNTSFLDAHQQSLLRQTFRRRNVGCRLEFYGGYEDSGAGYGFLRNAVSGYYAKLGANVSPDEIRINDGAKSDCGNITDIFSPDNIVLMTDPVYPVYADSNKMSGRRIIYADSNEANGFAAFTYQGKHFMLYPYSDFRNSTGHTFMLARNDSGTDFAGFQAMWRFPESGLGGNNSSTWDAPCTAVQAGGKMHLYVYSPANGLAAYVLQPNVLRGDVNGDGEVNVADVTALVNLVLNGDANERSDVNGDDETGIADVTALVNIIMAQ